MITPAQLSMYLKAQPFRPFRLYMASGQFFDVRHPEMVKVGKNSLLVFYYAATDPEFFELWNTVSLLLIESISHLDVPVNS